MAVAVVADNLSWTTRRHFRLHTGTGLRDAEDDDDDDKEEEEPDMDDKGSTERKPGMAGQPVPAHEHKDRGREEREEPATEEAAEVEDEEERVGPVRGKSCA